MNEKWLVGRAVVLALTGQLFLDSSDVAGHTITAVVFKCPGNLLNVVENWDAGYCDCQLFLSSM